MELQKTVIQAKPVTLSYNDQQEIITFVKDAWDRGKRERKVYEDHWKECEAAYHCRMPKIESPELDWMSNECLPWAFDASDSWYAHIHSTTIPRNDQIFTISGRTQEDHPGADVMQKYMEYRFERNQFPKQLGKAEKELSIRNHTCLKVYWREDITIEYNWVDDPILEDVIHPVTGQPTQIQTGVKKSRKPQEKTAFNNVWVDVVDIDSFVMWPIRGDFNKTTRIHETYRHYEDLIASADKTNYFNLSEISLDDERENSGTVRAGDVDNQDPPKQAPKGLKIKEAWIARIKIGDKVYRNYVATIVNEKTLIRFQPFPSGSPKSPFVFCALRPDKDCFYGYGINSKGLGLLKAANKKFNGWIDEGQLTQHQAHKYWDDGRFNPHNVVRRPGAMIEMAGAESCTNNLVPIIDNKQGEQILVTDLMALKSEFEQVTVPKVVKGMVDTQGADPTATEVRQAQSNSSGKMHIDAYHINEEIIEPVLELSYQAIYDRVQFDESIKEEIQLITEPHDANGHPMGELPILPFPEVDIKVVGYQNVIRKQEQLAAAAQVIGQLAQTPAGQYFKWYGVAEQGLELSDLDKDRLLMNDDERKQHEAQMQQTQQAQQQAAQQQQSLLVQKETAELQLKKEKQDQEYHIRQIELELQRIEIEAKYMVGQAELDLKTEAQDFQNVLGIHQAASDQMSSDQAAQLAQQKQAHAEQVSDQQNVISQQQLEAQNQGDNEDE